MSYLAALRHFQVLADPSCISPSFHSPHMEVLLWGIRQDEAQQGPARFWLPITSHLSSDPSAFLNVLIWLDCCVGNSSSPIELRGHRIRAMYVLYDPWCVQLQLDPNSYLQVGLLKVWEWRMIGIKWEFISIERGCCHLPR